MTSKSPNNSKSRRGLTGRKVGDSRKRLQIRVHAEGEKTEEIYLVHLNRQFRDVSVKIAPHDKTTPLEIVKSAIDDRTRSRKARTPYDEHWCVIDVDDHPNLTQALQLAQKEGIKVALSGPCFEIWFILHGEFAAASLTSENAQRKAYKALGCENKKGMKSTHVQNLAATYDDAVSRAKKLHQTHERNGATHPWNPNTNIWELTETIRSGRRVSDSGVPHQSRPPASKRR